MLLAHPDHTELGSVPEAREVPTSISALCWLRHQAGDRPQQRLVNTQVSRVQRQQTPAPALEAETCPSLREKGERHLPL